MVSPFDMSVTNWIMLGLATPVQFYVGSQFYIGAYKALRNGRAEYGYSDCPGYQRSLYLQPAGSDWGIQRERFISIQRP